MKYIYSLPSSIIVLMILLSLSFLIIQIVNTFFSFVNRRNNIFKNIFNVSLILYFAIILLFSKESSISVSIFSGIVSESFLASSFIDFSSSLVSGFSSFFSFVSSSFASSFFVCPLSYLSLFSFYCLS